MLIIINPRADTESHCQESLSLLSADSPSPSPSLSLLAAKNDLFLAQIELLSLPLVVPVNIKQLRSPEFTMRLAVIDSHYLCHAEDCKTITTVSRVTQLSRDTVSRDTHSCGYLGQSWLA